MAKGMIMSLDGFLAPFFFLSFKMCGQFQDARLHFVQRGPGSDSSASGRAPKEEHSFLVRQRESDLLRRMLWAEPCPLQNSYVDVLTPSTSECDCIWRWAFYKGDGCQNEIIRDGPS